MPRRGKARANGEGTIYEYPEGSGVWYAQITLSNGTRRKRRASSQREARAKLRKLQAELEGGVDLAAEQPIVAAWCAIWLETFAINLKPYVKEDYAGEIRRYITDAPIGKRKLNQLTAAEVQAWVNDLSKRLAPQTVHNAHARLHRALVVAMRQRYITRNVADDIELPSVRTPPIKPLDFDDAIALLEAAEGERWEALYWLAVNIGMRQAELLGLTWEALDLHAGTLRVYQQLKRIKNADGKRVFVLQSTKTRAGERTPQLSADLIAVLRAHREAQEMERIRCGTEWNNQFNLVFVTETGRPIHFTDLVRHCKGLLKRAHLPAIRFHDLRHTAATLMLDNGVSLVTVSKILGHATPAITATIYGHALDDAKAGAITGLSQRLRGKP
jgi:integrase